MVLNLAQRRSLASFCEGTAKGLAIAYVVGSLFIGKSFAAAIATSLQALSGIAFLLYINLRLLEEVNP